MAAWRYRFECYVHELQAAPLEESNALRELGITAADFLDAFSCARECNEAVGRHAAAVWAKHRDIAGAPPDVKQKCLDILSQPTKRSAEAVGGSRRRARLYPQSAVVGPIFQRSAAAMTSMSAVDLSGSDNQAKVLLQDIYDVYVAAGAAGTKWLSVPAGSEDRRQRIITLPLARRFDSNQLKCQLSFMKRWSKWCASVTPAVAPYSPAAIDSAFFLQQHSEGKPTVALNLFNSMKWWAKHVGVPFHVEHTAVLAFGVIAPGHITSPKKPIELEAMLRLIKAAMGGVGTVHILLRACILLTVSVIRFKHANISHRIKHTGRMIIWRCPKGKRIVAGQQAPFDWAMPRFLDPSCDLAGPLSAILDNMETELGQPVTFVVPDIAGSATAGITNSCVWAAGPMPYEKWMTVLQAMPSMLGLKEDEATKMWGTYTFRRLLPTIADIVGLHPCHSQALGEWVENVSITKGNAARAQPLMCHRYADCKVTTAGETKLLVSSAIVFVASRFPEAKSWEEMREAGVSVADLDKFVSSGGRWIIPAKVDTLDELEVLQTEDETASKSDSESSGPSKGSSSPAGSASELHPSQESLEWFAQPGNTSRAHIMKTVDSANKKIPYCRVDKPFFRFAASGGSSLDSAASWPGGVCDSCLEQMPQALAKSVLAAIFRVGQI